MKIGEILKQLQVSNQLPQTTFCQLQAMTSEREKNKDNPLQSRAVVKTIRTKDKKTKRQRD